MTTGMVLVDQVIEACREQGDVATIVQAVRNFRRNGYVGLSGLNPQDRALAAYEETLREMTSDDAYERTLTAVEETTANRLNNPRDPGSIFAASTAMRRLDAIREGRRLLASA